MSDHEFGASSTADDLSLPKATIQKIVTEILAPSEGVALSKEARDILIDCCVEFITLVSSEANEISEREAKKTIACDHITRALDQLGYGEYNELVMAAANEHRDLQKGRERKSNKLNTSNMTLEELALLQQQQFAESAARHT